MTRLAFAASIALLALCLPVSAQTEQYTWTLAASFGGDGHQLTALVYAEASCNPATDARHCCRANVLNDHLDDPMTARVICSELLSYNDFRGRDSGRSGITSELLEHFGRDVLEGHFIELFHARPSHRQLSVHIRS